MAVRNLQLQLLILLISPAVDGFGWLPMLQPARLHIVQVVVHDNVLECLRGGLCFAVGLRWLRALDFIANALEKVGVVA